MDIEAIKQAIQPALEVGKEARTDIATYLHLKGISEDDIKDMMGDVSISDDMPSMIDGYFTDDEWREFKALLPCRYEIGYGEGRYIIIDPVSKSIRLERDIKGGERIQLLNILSGYPEDIYLYIDPIADQIEYSLDWIAPRRPARHITGTPSGIYAMLSENGHVLSSQGGKDILNIILDWMVRNDKVKIQNETRRPGLYLRNNRIIEVSPPDRRESTGDIKKGLEGLNTIIEGLYSHATDKAATVVKWFLFAPFAYIYKTALKKRFRWLYLSGESYTGKSTIAHLGLSLWGLNNAAHEKSFSSINSQARIGNALATGTYPIVIDETGDMWEKSSIIDIIKNSIDSKISRSIQYNGVYTDWPALATLAFTSNERPPDNAAIDNRMIQVLWTSKEIISDVAAALFNEEAYYQPDIGPAVGEIIKSMWAAGKWVNKNWREIVEAALSRLYIEADLSVPAWVLMGWNETRRKHTDTTEGKIRAWIIKQINDLHSRHIRQTDDMISTPRAALTKRYIDLVYGGYMPYMQLKKDDTIWLFADIMLSDMSDSIRSAVVGDEENLKHILKSRIAGAKNEPRKINNISKRILIFSLKSFMDFLLQDGEEEEDTTAVIDDFIS